MKKSIIGKMLFFILAFFLVQPSMPAAAAEKSFIGVTTAYEGVKGKVVTISVYIEGAEESAGGSLEVSYDDTALTILKAEAGNGVDGYLTSINSEAPGSIEVSWAKAEEKIQLGTLLTFQARLSKTNETIAINIDNAALYKADFSPLEVEVFDGEVKPFKGSEQKHQSKVKKEKEWKVRLNNAFNPATANKHNVWVTDKYGKPVEVSVKVADQTSFIISPKTPYTSGTYTITISDQIRGQDGKKLKQPIKFEFTVE